MFLLGFYRCISQIAKKNLTHNLHLNETYRKTYAVVSLISNAIEQLHTKAFNNCWKFKKANLSYPQPVNFFHSTKVQTFVKEGAFDLDLLCSPVATLNLETPWYLSPESSAGL